MDYWQDIVRDFKLKKYQDVREMVHYAMERFLHESAKAGPHFLPTIHREYLKAVHEELKLHYEDLWDAYWEDPEYQKVLAESGRWIKALRKSSPKPPLTYRDLMVCLGSAEAYMLVVEDSE